MDGGPTPLKVSMKRFSVLAILAGVTLLCVLIGLSGAEGVAEAVASAGWGAALVVAIRAVAIAVDGVAWWLLFPPRERLALRLCLLLRWLREALNQLLPVAQVGGDFIGARLATFWRFEGALAGASVIGDIATQAGTQFVFAVLGLAMLVWLNGDSDLARYVGFGLLVAAFGLGGFFLVQRRHGARLLTRLLRHVAGGREWAGVAAIERLFQRLGDIYAHPRGVALSALTHMGVWIFGSLEVWVALKFMGHPVSFAEAIVIESLGQAVRGAAFAIPGGLGIQEGGYVALCALFGIPPGPALALSLVKRLADLSLGLPGLLAWQVIEGRRVFGRSGSRPDRTRPGYLAESGR